MGPSPSLLTLFFKIQWHSPILGSHYAISVVPAVVSFLLLSPPWPCPISSINCIYLYFPLYREAWLAAVHGVAKSQTWLTNWTELNWYICQNSLNCNFYLFFRNVCIWLLWIFIAALGLFLVSMSGDYSLSLSVGHELLIAGSNMYFISLCWSLGNLAGQQSIHILFLFLNRSQGPQFTSSYCRWKLARVKNPAYFQSISSFAP